MHFLFKRFPIWLVLLSGPAVFSQVCLWQPPQFTEAGRAVTIRAFADDHPVRLTLTWTSDTQNASSRMLPNDDTGCWTAVIPASAIEGTELRYVVTAEYDQKPSDASGDCTLYICPQYTTLKPQPMILTQTIVTQKKWNSNDDAFGLLKPEQGPPAGPASIAYHNGNVYILDSVNQRVLTFSKTGTLQHPPLTIPTNTGSDLLVDPADDSLVVVSQLDDKVHQFRNGQLQTTVSVPMKHDFEYPTKFNYDPHTKTLFVHKPNRRENLAVVAPTPNPKTDTQPVPQNPAVFTGVRANLLMLKTGDCEEIFAATFDRPVGYIDEAIADNEGIVWVLFTLQGDYRVRRLARIDTLNAQAETAQINIWFSFDATRRMALTDNGIVCMAGDAVYGRIVAFDYTGGVQ